MYRCRDCGFLFEEPKKYSEDRTPGGVFEGGSFIEEYMGCPRCSESYDEVFECNCCSEYYFDEELTDTTGMINGGIGKVCEQCMEDYDKGGFNE